MDEASNVGSSCSSSSTGTGVDASASKKKPARMIWDNKMDLILIGEVILARPYQFRQGSRERGRAWKQVADAMKTQTAVKVLANLNQRAVRDRISHLMDRVKADNRKDKAASGIGGEETEEEAQIRTGIEDLIQEELDIESAPKEKGDEEKKKAEGTEMRKRALETYGETRKRAAGDNINSPKKRRNNGSETLVLIKRKMELDQAAKREEKEKKREEDERRRQEELTRAQRYEALQQQQLEQQRQFQQQLTTQQQQYQQQQQNMQQQMLQQQQLLQQQHQQSQTFMLAVLKALGKDN